MNEIERHTLQEWRRLRNLTQLQLAIRAQLTPTTISDYETGQYAPNAENWVRIAAALSTAEETLVLDQILWPAMLAEKPTSWRKSTAVAITDDNDDTDGEHPKAHAA